MSDDSEGFDLIAESYFDPILAQRPYFWMGVYEKIRSSAERRAFRGPVPPCHSFEFDVGNVGWVVKNGIRKVVPDVSKDTQYSQCFVETQSEWIEPLIFEKQVVGLLDIEQDRKDAFSKSDESILTQLAAQLSPLFAWTSAPWTARLNALEILSGLRRKHKFFDWIGIYRTDETDVVLSAYFGSPTDHVRIAVKKGLCGAAVRERRTVCAPNVREDPRFISCSSSTQSELVVPIFDDSGRVVAEIDIDSDTPDAFTAETIARAEAAAAKIGSLSDLFKYPRISSLKSRG